ncbi:MAG: histidine kinase [Ferruginibacter sp.]|nr:histidine kinase [Ferruginibacter sp.]
MQTKRYSLGTVFLVVLGLNLFFTLLGLFVIMVLKVPEAGEALKDMFTLKNLVKHVVGLVSQTLFYYYSLNYYNKLIVEKRTAIHFVGYTFLMLVAVFVYFMVMLRFFGQGVEGGKATTSIMMFSFAISSIFFTASTMLLAYLNNLRDEKKHRKVLEAQKMQLEVDKSHANFKFLKSQINPHFLHNTLNFLYAKSLPYSPELSEGILTLSDIMRYALNEATGSDDKAPLKDEIEHVRNVIKINQLRFSNNLNVHFEVEGVINGLEIIPFLLITVVENAFKHGDLQRTEHPITVKLTIEHKRLHFFCHNKKKTGPKEISTGLGLDNIRNRLDFAYGKNYQFDIKEDAEFYTTELTIYEL